VRKPKWALAILISLLFVQFSHMTITMVYSADELSATVSPSNATTIDANQQLQFTVSVSGGAPPYSYQWYSNDNQIANATSSSFTFAPNYPGTYDISVIVTDSLDIQASPNATSVTVNPWLSMYIEQGSATTNVDQPVQFTVLVTGGTPPYSYQWSYWLYPEGDPVAGATSSIFIFTPTSSGTYIIELIVTDAINAQESSGPLPLTVTVLAEPTPSPSPTPTPTPTSTPTPTPTPTPSPSPTPIPIFGGSMAYPIIALSVIIIVIAIAALVLFRTQRHE
jgi:hypothetical protein